MDQSGGVENSTYFWFFNPLLVFLSPISQLSQFYALLHFLEVFYYQNKFLHWEFDTGNINRVTS